jgi:hypothetical protein
MTYKHIVFFSGGFGSWMAAKRLRALLGPDEPIHLLFTDTLIEDEDLYRFLPEAAADVGGELITISDGRDPWEVFRDVKFLGNSRADPCSRVLKRDLSRKWVNKNCDKETTTLYAGILWDEAHRLLAMRKAWEPWKVSAPMCLPPLEPLGYEARLNAFASAGIKPPRLYTMGFTHNNCGGFCVKAGHGAFRRLLEKMPERFHYHETKEEQMREQLGDVSILRDRRGGTSRPLTMKEFRERLRSGDTEQLDLFSEGGCGCFS